MEFFLNCRDGIQTNILEQTVFLNKCLFLLELELQHNVEVRIKRCFESIRQPEKC